MPRAAALVTEEMSGIHTQGTTVGGGEYPNGRQEEEEDGIAGPQQEIKQQQPQLRTTKSRKAYVHAGGLSPLSRQLWRDKANYTASAGSGNAAVRDDACARLTWMDLSVSVTNGRGESRTLLHGLTGYAEPGCMLAIMGPSGSGKTSLLDSLAGKNLIVESMISSLISHTVCFCFFLLLLLDWPILRWSTRREAGEECDDDRRRSCEWTPHKTLLRHGCLCDTARRLDRNPNSARDYLLFSESEAARPHAQSGQEGDHRERDRRNGSARLRQYSHWELASARSQWWWKEACEYCSGDSDSPSHVVSGRTHKWSWQARCLQKLWTPFVADFLLLLLITVLFCWTDHLVPAASWWVLGCWSDLSCLLAFFSQTSLRPFCIRV